MKGAFAIWLLAFACFVSRSQVPSIAPITKNIQLFQLSGKVIDTAGIALSHATVQYIAAWDSNNTSTSDNGAFVFPHLPSRKFRLTVTMQGYQPFTRIFNVGNGKSLVQLSPLTLHTNYLDLDPVTISRVRPITLAEDTVTYHTAAYPVRDGADVEDILKRLPGVKVDMDGNVIVQGKKIEKVLVDGKEFFGSDVLLAISNLPADVVDKLQVIDDYGDKARLTGINSGDAAKVLNIVLKPDKRNGEFGRAEAGAGSQGKYLGDAFANAFKGERQMSAQAGISNKSLGGSDKIENGGVNYADQWNPHWGIVINLNSSSQSPHSSDSTSQKTYYPGEILQQTQDNRNIAHSTNTHLDTRLTYKPDTHSTLRFTASGGLLQSNNQVSGNFTALQQDSGYTKSSNGQSLNTNHSIGQNLNTNLYYEKLSPYSRQRFSIEGGLGYNGSTAFNNSQSTATVISDSSSSPSFLHFLNTNYTRNWNMHLNTDYFLPLGRTSFLEFGYRAQSVLSQTNVVTQQSDSGSTALITIDSLSQKMVLQSLTQNIHTGYTAKLNHLDVTAGLDAQPGMQKGTVDTKGDITSYKYFILLPKLEAAWNIDKSRHLNLNYNSQPILPNLQQLAPVTNVSNPQYPVTGNPDLKQSYTANLALHYEQSSLRPTQFFGFGMGLTYSSTRHTIIQNLTTPKDSSQVIQATTYLNAATTNSLTADYHLTLPAILEKRFRINFNGSVSKAQTITMTDSLQYLTQTWTWNQSIHFQLLIPDLIETDFSGNYIVTNTLYPAGTSLPNIFRSAAVTLNSRHYFFHHWILNYQASQAYTSNGTRLQPAPASLAAYLQRQLLPHNKATITLAGYNLLNQSAAAGQSVSPTTITYYMPALTGRYFLLSFQLKLQRFR